MGKARGVGNIVAACGVVKVAAHKEARAIDNYLSINIIEIGVTDPGTLIPAEHGIDGLFRVSGIGLIDAASVHPSPIPAIFCGAITVFPEFGPAFLLEDVIFYIGFPLFKVLVGDLVLGRNPSVRKNGILGERSRKVIRFH